MPHDWWARRSTSPDGPLPGRSASFGGYGSAPSTGGLTRTPVALSGGPHRPALPRRRANVVVIQTANSNEPPLKTPGAQAAAPAMLSPLTAIATKKTPTMAPRGLGSPGLMVVAPRNTAASAGKRKLGPALVSADPARAHSRTPAIPARRPPMVMLDRIMRSTRMPTRRADFGLLPIALSWRP